MMFCTTSRAWSHPVLSLCCTEHGQHHSVILLGCIITVAMSKCDQLGRCYTVELHCSSLHVLQALQ
jgi:hypothetical protein